MSTDVHDVRWQHAVLILSITCAIGGSMAPVYNPTHFSQLTALPPPSPPSGGATTAVLLPATNELATSTVTHPAGEGM